MSRSMWIELERPEDAKEVAFVLEFNGLHTDTIRSLDGTCEVNVRKPLFRRAHLFRNQVVALVRRWVDERAPEELSLTIRIGEERVEMTSPARGAFETKPESADRDDAERGLERAAM